MLRGNHSRVIGNELLLGNADVAVWSFVIPPGEDAPIHRHQHSYFFLNLGEPVYINTFSHLYLIWPVLPMPFL